MKDDGGPAFPQSLDNTPATAASGLPAPGLSLRDYFAAAAMTGAMANERLLPSTELELTHLSMRVYEMADAMLLERAKP